MKRVGNKRGAYNYKNCFLSAKNEKNDENYKFYKSIFSQWILEKRGRFWEFVLQVE